MSKPLVSVIMPCYGQAQYLTESVQSLFHQSYKYWECIIIDDDSPDDTAHIAQELCQLDSRVKYFRQKNGGPSSARNNGISRAVGEYILPLDADDKIGERYLEEAVKVFNQQDSVSLVYCLAQKFGKESGIWKLADYSYAELLKFNMIFCTSLFRKSDWERVGGYDETLRRGWEDWEFWISMLDENSKVVKLEAVHFYYRLKEQSRSTEIQKKDFEEMGWYIFQKHMHKYKKFYPNPIRLALEHGELKYENELLKKKLDGVFDSNSYKIGNTLVKKLAFLKELQTKK